MGYMSWGTNEGSFPVDDFSRLEGSTPIVINEVRIGWINHIFCGVAMQMRDGDV